MRAESIFGALEEEDTADLDREWRIRIYNQGLRTLIDGIKCKILLLKRLMTIVCIHIESNS
jgi:hypothetical protein